MHGVHGDFCAGQRDRPSRSPILGRIWPPASAAMNLDEVSGMGRNPRQRINGGIYHVMNRGNRKMRIFEDVRDRRRFVRILIEETERYGVLLLAGCEMVNHFHLIVATPNGNVSEFMEQLEGRFARYFNWRHGTVGHLFQGRFRDVVIEHDTHLLIALCYVYFNPVSARLVTRPEDYEWSTYAATVGIKWLPKYISINWLTVLFDGASVQEAQRRLRGLMTEANPVAAYLRQDEMAVDPEAVRRVLRSHVGEQLRLGTLPRLYGSALRSSLSTIVDVGSPTARAAAIHTAHVEHGYTLAEIARELRLHKTTVSKIFCAFRRSHRSSAA
jgi:putative transposase